jgi:trans-aconitate 2-methyltransferase
MTEWDAQDYARISELQMVMADESLGLLQLKGTEQVLDVGCGDGKVTAEVAARVPDGLVVGIDPSAEMIHFAQQKWGADGRRNLRFEVADARRLPFETAFDLVVSFNALHWVREQEEALKSIRAALRPNGAAQLRLVPQGPRKSLEDVIRETWQSAKWKEYFPGFRQPYLHLTPEEYAKLAEQAGLNVEGVRVSDKSWDFHRRSAFYAFATVTFVEWTHLIPEERKHEFIHDVLDRYDDVVGEKNTFKFYQMDIRLGRA